MLKQVIIISINANAGMQSSYCKYLDIEHDPNSVIITLNPMARYRRSIWSQVCSSHNTKLMEVLIFGAVGGKLRLRIHFKDLS